MVKRDMDNFNLSNGDDGYRNRIQGISEIEMDNNLEIAKDGYGFTSLDGHNANRRQSTAVPDSTVFPTAYNMHLNHNENGKMSDGDKYIRKEILGYRIHEDRNNKLNLGIPHDSSVANLGYANGSKAPNAGSLVKIDQRDLIVAVQDGNMIGDHSNYNELNAHVNSLEVDRHSKPYLLPSAPP